jgi:hypothetical protein
MIANTFHGLVLGLAQRERTPNQNAPHTVNAPPQTCGLRLRFPTHSHRRPLVCGAIAGNKNLTNPIHAPRIDPGKNKRTVRKRLFLTLYASTGNTRVARKFVDFTWRLPPGTDTFCSKEIPFVHSCT